MDEISVMICDDSALMRSVISKVVDGAPGMYVAQKACNGQDLIEKLKTTSPDVIVLDIEMPVMTGIEFLRYKREHGINIPVIILSSIAEKGAAVTMEALELGASDFITKPNGSVSIDINSVADKLIELISSYGGSYARRSGKRVYSGDYYSKLTEDRAIQRKLQETLGSKADAVASKVAPPPPREFDFKPVRKEPAVITPLKEPGRIAVIAIGISTGGPNALREVFKNIDPNLKQPILVVQHMPAGFTKEFAASLNKICPLEVKEAEDGDILKEGHIYIAPGDYHIEVERASFGQHVIHTNQKPLRNGHRPSADQLFESVAKIFKNNALGVIMTGMGKDGAVELAEMRKQGARTLGQDEKSAIVYGMPRVAYELGAVQKQLSLENIAAEINRLARENA